MEIPSPKSLNSLLPKELLKSFEELEDEYLGSFLSSSSIEAENKNKGPQSTTTEISQRELLVERKKITRALNKPCICGQNCQKRFTVEEIVDAREDFRNMSWREGTTKCIFADSYELHGRSSNIQKKCGK